MYGTAVLLEEVGKVIKRGDSGVTISSQSGHRMAALTAVEDEQLVTTSTEELLLSNRGAFITGADFLIDGGATASFFYGALKVE